MLTTDSAGVVWWQFPVSLPATPVVTATVVASQPHTVTVRGATPHAVALHVWDARGRPAPGIPIHALAFPTA